MAGNPVFQIRGGTVRFDGTTALADVDLVVSSGERVAIIGPSGAGKSTLIGLMNGTVAATGGEVRVLGCDYSSVSSRQIATTQCRVGTIHQQFDLVPQLRAVHNVNAGKLGRWPFWKAAWSLILPRERSLAEATLARVGLADKLHERTGDLSGGEQQRVAIARVLVQEPVAILADEPVASLDPARGAEVMNLLTELSVEAGATLLASLHDVDIALDRFERVVGLRHGRVVFDKPRDALADHELKALYALERNEDE